MTGSWDEIGSRFVSNGAYVASGDQDAALTFRFVGDRLRLNYVTYFNFGVFDVYLDGEKLVTIDGYHAESMILSSGLIIVAPGEHVLRIQNSGRSSALCQANIMAIDSIEAFDGNISSTGG